MIQVTLVVIRVSLCTRNLNDAINVHLYWWEREEIVLGIKQPTKYKWHKYEGSCNAAISQTWLENKWNIHARPFRIILSKEDVSDPWR